MTSFAAVELFMRATLPGAFQSEHGQIIWEAPLDTGRSQVVIVVNFRLDDEDLLWIFSPFASVEALSPAQLGEVLEKEGIGITISGEVYGFVHFVPLDGLDPNELLWPLTRLARNADRVEQYFGLGDSL